MLNGYQVFFNLLDILMFSQGNNVAHGLAKRALREPNLTVWIEDVPPDIHHIVQADLANFE